MRAKREQKKSNVFMYPGFTIDNYLICSSSALFLFCLSRNIDLIYDYKYLQF